MKIFVFQFSSFFQVGPGTIRVTLFFFHFAALFVCVRIFR